jgi:hypothetical protein
MRALHTIHDCLPYRVEATHAIRHYKSGIDVYERDILVVVGAYPCVEISPVRSPASGSAEACYGGMIFLRVAYEEMIEYYEYGSTTVHYGKVATR